MRIRYALAAAVVACAPTAAFADVLTYNDTPAATYYFGNNTNYSPANSAVLTTGTDATLNAGEDQLFARFHTRYPNSLGAPMSDGDTYSFALGTGAPSFDYGVTSANGVQALTGLITVTNLATGVSRSFNPFLFPDNQVQGNTLENSQNLRFGFLFGTTGPDAFNDSVDNTYRMTFTVDNLASGSKSLTINARYGLGATGAVPEPATWAMMLLGFAMVGAAARSARRRTNVSFA